MRFRIEDRGSRIEPKSGGGVTRSSIPNPQSSRGFTLLELVIVIVIMVTLMSVFLDRVMFYQEQAEKTAMEQVAGSLQSALILQVSQLMTRGQPSDLPALAHDNPMNWLQEKPPNYKGEFYEPSPLTVESGSWMFDLKSRDLVYVVRNANHFTPGRDGKQWVRFRVVTQYEHSRLPSLQSSPAELTSALVQPVEPYMWFKS